MKTPARYRTFWLCLGAQILFLFTGSASANKGFLNFAVWNRSQISHNQLFGSPNSYETIFHLDFSQDITNFGTVTAWTDGLLSKGNGRFSRGLVTWTGLKIGALTFDLKGGDDYFQNSNLDSRFINLYHLYIFFRGASAGFTSRAFDLAAYGGKIARLTGLLGYTYDILDESFAGLKARVKFRNVVMLGGGVFHSENLTDVIGNPLAKKNDLFLADSEITITPGVKILGEFRRNLADQASLGKTSGNSYRFGPLIRSGRWDFEANYRFIGSRFLDLTPESQIFRDEEGLFSSVRFQVSRGFALFDVFDRYRDNVDRDPSQNVNNTFSMTSGFNFSTASLFDLTAQWEYDRRKSEKVLPYFLDSRSNGVYLEASKTLGQFFPYFRFRWQRTYDNVFPWMNATLPTFFLGFRQGLGAGSYLWMEAELDRRYNASHHEVDRNVNVRSGLSCPISSKFDIYAELVYHRFGLKNTIQQLEAYVGLRISLFRDTTLTFDFRGQEPLNGKKQPSNYMFTVRLNRRFSWGAPPRILGRYGLIEGPIGLGAIDGFVFEDRNENGKMDAGDKGLAGISVRLEDGSTVVTNAEGRYRFSNVAQGPHQVGIEDRSIPATLYTLSPTQANVLVERRVTKQLLFSMISGAGLSGSFVEDLNLDGKIDKDDKALPDVMVFLTPIKKEGEAPATKQVEQMILNTFTDAEGAYVFDNILPGEYELSVDEETLPKGDKVVVPLPLKIKLEAGRTIEAMNFLVNPRPVVIREIK